MFGTLLRAIAQKVSFAIAKMLKSWTIVYPIEPGVATIFGRDKCRNGFCDFGTSFGWLCRHQIETFIDDAWE